MKTNVTRQACLCSMIVCMLLSSAQCYSQSLSYSGSFCVGSSIDFYTMGSGNCGGANVSGPGGWYFSHTPSSVTFPNAPNYNRVKATWNYVVSGMLVRASYTCSIDGVQGDVQMTGVLINPKVAPGVSLTINNSTVCYGSSIQLNASPTIGGSSPAYRYYVDGGQVYSGSTASYVHPLGTTATGNHTAYVTMTTSAPCANPGTVASSIQTFTISPKADLTVSVSGPGLICTGTSTVDVYAIVARTVGTLSYEWFVNGAPSWGSNFKTVNVNQGTSVYVKVHSSHSCVNTPKQSNTYTINVSGSVTPVVGIMVPKLNWCPGETMSLTASSSNGGAGYTWFVNGNQFSTVNPATIPVSATNGTNVFSSGSVITVRVTGMSGTCLSQTWAEGTTNGSGIMVHPLPTPGFSSGPATVCQGSSGNLYATEAGKSNYQWTVSPGGTITSGGGVTNSSVTVTWTTVGARSVSVNYRNSNGCTAATPSVKAVTVNATVPPSVSFSITNQNVCYGSNVQLNAFPTNGGSNPTYKYYVDGALVNTGPSPSYTHPLGSLAAGNHSTYVVMMSSATCPSPATATSSAQPFTITPKANFTVSVSGPGLICAGTSAVDVYANVTGAVGTLSYEWFVNGAPSWGSNFKTVYVNQGTSVYVKVHSNHSCINTPKQSANTYTINVTNSVVPVVGIAVPRLSWCPGETMSLTATSSNGGTGYTWFVNGNQFSTANPTTIPVSATSGTNVFSSGSVVTVRVTGMSGTCLSKTWADGSTSGSGLVVHTSPTPGFSSGPTTVCQGSSGNLYTTEAGKSNYQWTVSPGGTIASGGGATNSSVTVTWTTAGSRSVSVIYKDKNGCIAITPGMRSVTVVAPPTVAAAGPDQTGLSTCGLKTITLNANTPSVGVGSWSIVSGANGVLGNASSSHTILSGIEGTTYTARWSITNSPCPASIDDVNIKFNRHPTQAAAGPDQTSAATCGLVNTNLAANTPVVGQGAWSIASGTGGAFDIFTKPNARFTGLPAVSYTLRWSITNSPCPASTDDVLVRFNRTASVANAGPDRTGPSSCGLTSLNLAANTPTAGIGYWSVVTGSGFTFGNTSSPASSFSGTVGSTYTLRWTITSSPCPPSFDDVAVAFHPAVTTLPSVTGNIRFGAGSLNLEAHGAGPGEGYRWYDATGQAQPTASLFKTPEVSVTTSPYNHVRVVNATACIGPPKWVNIIIHPFPKITVDTDRVYMGSQVTLSVQPYDSYTWMNHDDEFVSRDPVFQTRLPGIYRVTVMKDGLTATSDPVEIKGQFDGQLANYIVSYDVQVDRVTSSTDLPGLPSGSLTQYVQYFDGFGRPLQTVATRASPSGADLITPFWYDDFGREIRKYLPFTAEDNGWYKVGVINSLGSPAGLFENYYRNTSDKIADDVAPFAETVYESSPLNRVIEQGSPGIVWQPGTGRTIKQKYHFNAAGEVVLFRYDHTAGILMMDSEPSSRFYRPAHLFATKTIDEHNNDVITFIDKEGRVVCKKVRASATEYAATYYVYDELGNLVVVLPPEAVREILSE